MSTLSLRLLGSPEIRLDDQPLHFASRKAVALLAYLAVENEPCPRAEMAALLWPESARKQALGALRYTLSLLREPLGDWLAVDRQSLALPAQAGLIVDVRRFQMLRSQSNSSAPLADRLTEAVALHHSDFLSGFTLRDSIAWEEWHRQQDECLNNQLCEALEALIHHHAERQELDAAFAHAQRWLAVDPLREAAHRALMQLYADAGQRTLALRQYEQCVDLLRREMQIGPSASTQRLHQELLLGAASPTAGPSPLLPRRTPHNLPADTTPFVGREQELAEIEALLRSSACRLLTLISPGGVGKTRLALASARNLAHGREPLFADGVYLVPLAASDSFNAIVTTIGGALRFAFSGAAEPQTQIINYLREKSLLLVLDNFEHLISSALLLVNLLEAAPKLKLLVTSRERLNLHEEWLFEVEGLPVEGHNAEEEERGEEGGKGGRSAALQLFEQRARRLQHRFLLGDHATAVAEICRLLHGVPLGIELAAGLIRERAPAALAEEITHNLDMLATDAQNVPPRQRSLRAVFLHSWHLLTADEQRVFQRLSLFRGSFSVDAAHQVAGASSATLQRLGDKSMVTALANGQGKQARAEQARGERPLPGRLVVHELLRQYGAETLSPAERAHAAWAHACFFTTFLSEQATQFWRAGEEQALDAVDSEFENIRAAWRWLAQQFASSAAERAREARDEVERVSHLFVHYLQQRGLYAEGIQLFEEATAALTSHKAALSHTASQSTRSALLARLQINLASLLFYRGDYARVQSLVAHSLEELDAHDSPIARAEALTRDGMTAIRQGDIARASFVLEEAITLHRKWLAAAQRDQQVGDVELHMGETLISLAILRTLQQRTADAVLLYQRCLHIYRRRGYLRGVVRVLNNLGTTYARSGQFAKAQRFYSEAMGLANAEAEPLSTSILLSNLGSSARALHDPATAEQHFRASLITTRNLGERRWTAVNLISLGMALLDLEEPEQAREHLLAGLRLAQQLQALPDVLDALVQGARLLATEARRVEACTLWQFVVQHPSSKRLATAEAQRYLDALWGGMSTGAREAAARCVEALSLDGAIQLVEEVVTA